MSDESELSETSRDHRHHGGTAALALGALGIVYGDIGTSPLYAFREAFEGHDLEVTDDGVLGACSLTFWALAVICALLRYVLDAHWPSDVVGGAVIGILMAYATTEVAARV